MSGGEPRRHLFEEMTWREIDAAATAGLPVVVAIGATEQHGPHLPVSTDWIIPVAIEQQAALTVPLIVGPPIRFGASSRPLSGGGERFPGTLSMRASTLISTVTEVICGLRRSGFRNVCVHNWHFENAGLLWEACDLAVGRHDDLSVLLIEDPFRELDTEELDGRLSSGFDGWAAEHASAVETSMMLAIRPDLVRTDLIRNDAAARRPSWDVLPYPDDFTTTSGVLARPEDASPEIGAWLLTEAADFLCRAVRTEFGS